MKKIYLLSIALMGLLALPTYAQDDEEGEDEIDNTFQFQDADGNVTESTAQQYGFRDISLRGYKLYINGQLTYLKGADRHDIHPKYGKALPVETMIQDIVLYKRNNMNTVRTSHYPNDPKMAALYDYYGLYVMCEADQECHGNDWQTALVPIYLKDDGVREECYRSIKTTLTIHNIEYQGRYGQGTLGDLFGLDHGWAEDGTIMMDGDVNLLKGAILCADAVNAVSPTYANELKMAYFAHRLDGIMRQCGYKLSGVLNGIDMKRYDPANDDHIAARFSVEDMAGKAVNKAEPAN